ncbi:hypothetical protein G3I24_46515, partial [Micromonospora aurantiaca]|nr:hypothetical protein [Micromonospora aurantiaca]
MLTEAEDVLRRVTAEDTGGDAEILAEVGDDPVARAVLDGTLDSCAHLVPVRGADGTVADFLYAELNAATRDMFGRGGAELTGLRLLRTDPGAVLSGLFDEYVGVLETGRPAERP